MRFTSQLYRNMVVGAVFVLLYASVAMTQLTSNQGSNGRISKERALEIARAEIATLKPGTEFVILSDKTLERTFGWVFFYTTQQYRQTGNPSFAVPGAGPLIVLRADGSTQFLSTSVPPAVAVEEFEKRWREKTPGH